MQDAQRVGRSLLERRLVVVTGKGGTGKTTVAAGLALAAAAQGLRVVVAEVGPDEQLPRRIRPRSKPVGYTGRELVPGLHALRIDPFTALAEYLALQVGGRALFERAFSRRGLGPLLDAAPGWRELITLGKIWHLEQQLDAGGRPRFDLIVVDAPATGHGLTFLDVPRVVASAARSGPLRRNSERVEELVRDRARTAILPVSLAEELPARETGELTARLREELKLEVELIVVNAVPEGVSPGLGERLRALPAGAVGDPSQKAGITPELLAHCAERAERRAALAAHYVRDIANRTGVPTVILPEHGGDVIGIDTLTALGNQIVALEPAP